MNFTGKLLPNQILVKLRIQNDTIADGKLFIDRAFNEMEHTDIIGEVVLLPERMFIRDVEQNIIERPVELEVGDTVYMFYLAVQQALKQQRREKIVYNPEGRLIRENGETYLIINFPNNVFMALRGDKVIPVNDYVLIEPTYKELSQAEEKAKTSGIAIPDSAIAELKKNTNWGIIRHVGQNLSQSDTGLSDEDIKPGKEVYMRKFADIPLEYELHKTFEPERNLCRVLRRDILYVAD